MIMIFSANKQKDKQEEIELTVNTFENIAREWYNASRSKWSESHAVRILVRLENYIFPLIGNIVKKRSKQKT